jgi:hypothetical protein
LDVVPVSDPSIFSDTQRFAQTQAIIQRAQAMPQLYDARKVEERFLRDMKVPESEVLQPKPASEDMDPVSENVAATVGSPVYVLPNQDHMAHIMVHMGFLKSPVFGQNPMIQKTFLFPMATHLRDHLLNYYLKEAHTAVDMAHKQNLIKEEASEQVQVIAQVQQFIEQQLGQFSQELVQIDQQAQQFAPQPPMPPDNTMQVAQLNAQVQQAALQQRSQSDQARMQVEQAKMQADMQYKQAQLAQTAQFKQTDAQLKQAELEQAAQLRQAQLMVQEKQAQLDMTKEQMRQQGEDQRTAIDLSIRERMNQADNQTAMDLAQLEIATGEKFQVSTGTGVNPGAR